MLLSTSYAENEIYENNAYVFDHFVCGNEIYENNAYHTPEIICGNRDFEKSRIRRRTSYVQIASPENPTHATQRVRLFSGNI